jgi:hypothetical protein
MNYSAVRLTPFCIGPGCKALCGCWGIVTTTLADVTILCQAVEQWMQHDPEHEAAALELFSLIRYPTMSAKELCDVSQSPFVKRHPELTVNTA